MGKFVQLRGVAKHGDGDDFFICVDADNIQKIEHDQGMGILLITYYDEIKKNSVMWYTDEPVGSLLKRINEVRT